MQTILNAALKSSLLSHKTWTPSHIYSGLCRYFEEANDATQCKGGHPEFKGKGENDRRACYRFRQTREVIELRVEVMLFDHLF